MSISEQILRIQTDRNTIRTKLFQCGLVNSTGATLDDCATAIDGMANQGAVSATVQEGDTYTIPKGYHNGSGTVSGVAGGGNYSLQSKTVTPTKAQQNVTPDSGHYGISDVTVNAIPDNYQDVTPVTAGAADVLANKVIVDAAGNSVAGTMANNGAVSKTLSVTTTSYTIPKGYHNGSGKVSITGETKTATPKDAAQEIKPSSGKVLSSVIVEAIPPRYQDTTVVTAEAANVLDGKFFVTAIRHGAYWQIDEETGEEWYEDIDGNVLDSSIDVQYDEETDEYFYYTFGKVEGTMPNNGASDIEIDGLTTVSAAIPAGYHSGAGTVSLTGDIEAALAAI